MTNDQETAVCIIGILAAVAMWGIHEGANHYPPPAPVDVPSEYRVTLDLPACPARTDDDVV